MEYLLLIYEDEKIFEGKTERELEAVLEAYNRYTAEIRAAGVMKAGQALRQAHTATTVRVRNGRTTTTDGPFAETKEQLGGFYWIDVPTLAEAHQWAAKIPASETGSIEVRPVMIFGPDGPG